MEAFSHARRLLMRQQHFSDIELKVLDEARFCQKTDAINRRVNAAYFRGLGRTQ